MEIPKKPRWNIAYFYARKFIKREKITALPVDVFQLYKNESWLIISADNAGKIFPDYAWGEFYWNDIDAITFKRRGIYITIYNETFPYERIRWTIAHEIGHIVLRHLDDFKETCVYRSGLDEKKYGVLEQEAHAFAAGLLAPSALLMLCKLYDKESIQKHCNISKEAAEKCAITVNKRRNSFIRLTEVNFYKNQFNSFINRKVCFICDYSIAYQGAKYCPICGTKTLILGKGESNMHYSNIQIRQCCVCENEEIDSNARFCKICGTYILNRCSDQDCNLAADSNARFCMGCGKPTVFSLRNYFSTTWKEEKKSYPFPTEDIPF